MFLGGEWRESGAWMEVRSPYDDQVVGVVAQAGAREAAEAVDVFEQIGKARAEDVLAARDEPDLCSHAQHRLRGKSLLIGE